MPVNRTKKQIEASRRNGRKGGIKTAQGKAVSRLNARKHGIFASAITDHDDEALRGIHRELAEWIKPHGPVEGILVEKLAHTYLRLQRCARAEAEYHISAWERPLDSLPALSSYADHLRLGMHASFFDAQEFERSVSLFARYDKTLTNQLIQVLHEIERLQRMRLGDDVAPPLVADLNVNGANGD